MEIICDIIIMLVLIRTAIKLKEKDDLWIVIITALVITILASLLEQFNIIQF